MSLKTLLNKLKENDIVVSVLGDDLKLEYGDAGVPDFLLKEIRSNKESIVDFLKSTAVETIPKVKEIKEGYPLNSSQFNTWLEDKKGLEGLTDNLYSIKYYPFDIDKALFRKSCYQILNRHEILRAVFSKNEFDEVKQFFVPIEKYQSEIIINDEGLKKEEIDEAIIDELKKPFDLEAGPLVRFYLFKTDKDKWIYLLNIHHIISDSKSIDVINDDLITIYQDNSKQSKTSSLQPLRIQFKDYVVYEKNRLDKMNLENQKKYWLKQFEGELPKLNLNLGAKREKSTKVEAGRTTLHIDREVSNRFKMFCRERNVTVFAGLIAVLKLLFYRYSNQKDIIIGFPYHGREVEDLSNQVGFYAKGLALRTKFQGNETFDEFLRLVKNNLHNVYENRDYSFVELIKEIKPKRYFDRNVLFDVFVVLQNYNHKGKSVALENIDISKEQNLETGFPTFDLTLNFNEYKNGMISYIEYRKDIYESKAIEQLLGHFVNLLKSVMDAPERPISRAEMLSETEKRELLSKPNINNQNQNFRSLKEAIEFRLKRSKQETILFDSNKFEASEIDKKSNQFSRFLRNELDVQKGDTVLFDIQLDISFVIALVGVVKLGAVPILTRNNIPLDKINNYQKVISAKELLRFNNSCKKYDSKYLDSDVYIDEIALTLYNKDIFNPIRLTNRQCFDLFDDLNTSFSKQPVYLDLEENFSFSVLEILRSFTNPFEIILYNKESRNLDNKTKGLDFSLFYFGSQGSEKNEYEILLEGVKCADNSGYSAVWTPERHFNEFGGPYPNPSVLGAALAVSTKNLKIRSGSVVAPLHHPVRIAEEWSVIDNLSGGRAEVSFASGWNINDFILAPNNYKDRNTVFYDRINSVKKLWRGEKIDFINPQDERIEIQVYPKPVQSELPIWITATGNIDTFISAGKIGANILTGFIKMDFEELAIKIKAYRNAYKKHGHKGEAKVAIMLHTYIDETIEEATEKTKNLLKNYLSKQLDMLKKLYLKNGKIKKDEISAIEVDDLLSFATNKYLKDGSLIGTSVSCMNILNKFYSIGVNEIACLIDFGVDTSNTIDSIKRLTKLKDNFNSGLTVAKPDFSCHFKIRNHVKKFLDNCIERKTEKNKKISTILDLFLNQVSENPHSIAITCEDRKITYQKLQDRSNHLANHLIEKGVNKGDHVVVSLERSEELLIVIFAIFKTGAVYIPVSVKNPKSRLNRILNDIDPKLIVTKSPLIEVFHGYNQSSILCVDEINKELYNVSNQNIPWSIDEEDLAYIMFTSGTTGDPKGCMINHGALENFISGLAKRLEVNSSLKMLGLTSFTFDPSLLEFFLPLCFGGELIIANQKECDEIELLKHLIAKTKPTHVKATPSRWRMLLDSNWINKEKITILSGGEVLSDEIKNSLINCSNKEYIYTLYGPTETTIYTSLQKLTKNTKFSLGSALQNTQLYILSEDLELMPEGVLGEIYIGGQNTGVGYLNRPELTKEKFIPNPYKKGDKIYRSGDMGRWLPDGKIEFVGRKDNQIKILGHRIELGEIETFLNRIEEVKKSVVLLINDENGNKQLVAYLVCKTRIDTLTIKNELEANLPDYMIPVAYVILESFPLTSTEKIDKKALPLPDREAYFKQEYVAPQTEIELKLAQNWENVLGIEKIGIHDDFFKLGGQSLNAVQLSQKIHIQFNIRLDIKTIFENSTIAKLVTVIEFYMKQNNIDTNDLIEIEV